MESSKSTIALTHQNQNIINLENKGFDTYITQGFVLKSGEMCDCIQRVIKYIEGVYKEVTVSNKSEKDRCSLIVTIVR